MHYKRPTTKKDKVNGFVEGYNFKEVRTLDVTVETNAGGWESIDVSKEDRVLIAFKGVGYAKMNGKTIRLEGLDTENPLAYPEVLEIPAGVEVEMSGQLKYVCVKTRG